MNAKTQEVKASQIEITNGFQISLIKVLAVADDVKRREEYLVIVSDLNKHAQANPTRTPEEKVAFDDAFKQQGETKKRCKGAPQTGVQEDITDKEVLKANEMFKLRISTMGDDNTTQLSLRQDLLSQLGRKRAEGSKDFTIVVADYWHTASGKIFQEFNTQCIINNSGAVKLYEKEEKAGTLNEVDAKRLERLRASIQSSKGSLEKSIERFGDLTK